MSASEVSRASLASITRGSGNTKAVRTLLLLIRVRVSDWRSGGGDGQRLLSGAFQQVPGKAESLDKLLSAPARRLCATPTPRCNSLDYSDPRLRILLLLL